MESNRPWYRTPSRLGVAGAAAAVTIAAGFWAGHAIKGRALRASPSLGAFNLRDLRVPIESIVNGAPPGGIAALTAPRVVPIAAAGFLNPGDGVIGVTVNGQSRAYPFRIMTLHEVVNDELGGVPIAVIFCPLCDSITVVDRRAAGEVLEFGVSGYLYESNILCYDRAGGGLWSQLGFEAVSGPRAGRSLQHVNRWQLGSMAAWSAGHPDSTVLSFDTGHRLSYNGASPYREYLKGTGLAFPVSKVNGVLPPRAGVIGVRWAGRTRAYPLDRIRRAPGSVLRDQLGGGDLVVRAAPDGSIAVEQAPPDAAVAYSFWFAWYAQHPDTEIWGEPEGSQLSAGEERGASG